MGRADNMGKLEYRKDNLIFSLDIGTRTIIGIVGEYKDDNTFNILAYSIKEHDRRNMYDGQIHDIQGVADVAIKVKDELERKIGTSLKKVSIAAAGRALKTLKIRVDKEIDNQSEINKSTVEALELEALQRAQNMINADENQNKLRYHNIGYSVMNYYLDDDIMIKLEGHRGDRIGVQLLATFLPQVVVESLYSVILKANLQVDNITLEPIAAINVAIKEELRLLNLALVDIGAGTSDIAITKGGKIIAYAMTSTAGDEITETLSKRYLVDFNTGEKIKIGLSAKKEHKFTDIVGVEHNLTTDEIVKEIHDIIAKISVEISEKIIEFNAKAPDAVFLIGGSSQMPGLKECLADSLGLPKERVSIKDANFIQNVEGVDDNIKGPNIITPIGIAMEGVTQIYKNFLQIEFNDEPIRVFNTGDIKVSHILVLTGYHPRNLVPKAGDDFIYFLNGRKQVIKGKTGEGAKIYINNDIGNLNTPLKDGDIVKVIEGSKGERIIPYLYDCIPHKNMINLNGKQYNLIREIKVNGNIVKDNMPLKDGDNIEYSKIKTLGNLLHYVDEKLDPDNVLINGEKVDEDTILEDGDQITIIQNRMIKLSINGQEKTIEYNKKQFVFVDIFDYIDFDLTRPRGNLILKVNGEDAKYMEPLNDGDVLEIYWNK